MYQLGHRVWAHIHGNLIYTPTIKDLVVADKPKTENPFYSKAKELPSTGKKGNPFYKEYLK